MGELTVNIFEMYLSGLGCVFATGAVAYVLGAMALSAWDAFK